MSPRGSTLSEMEIGVLLTVLATVAVVTAIVTYVAPRLRGEPRDAESFAWLLFEQVADEVGGLTVVRTEAGWPRMRGLIEGIEVEVDQHNDVAFGLDGMLGLRCTLPSTLGAPNAAIWVGNVATLHSQFGRPHAVGDADALFDVYTRAEPGASDWWQEPDLLETLRALPGAGVLLYEGQLTVVFSDLDAHSVQTAMLVPSLILRGVDAVTIH